MPTHHLPLQASPFVGRAEELAGIAALLANPNCRLLSLVGPGGIGKTRLALEASRLHSPPQNAHFVPLQPLASPDFIVSAVADALGFQFVGGDHPKQQLFSYLHDKSWLLVLDNFEHLLEGAGLLSDILVASPDLRLLVTSRERLNLMEEWVLEVEGLAYPPSENNGDLECYSAVELFMQQARRVKANFRLTAIQRPAVARICRMVGGMPLGVELAASWVRALSCEAIADEIARSLDILETPARNVEPRHRTMRAAFAPTWNRLSEDERAVFMRLSVFRGGFTREAAEQVAGASLRILSALVDKSLLRLDENGRYDLHELLRQYAAEHLLDGDEADAAHRHLHYFMKLAEQAEVHEYGPEQTTWYDRLEFELDNLRADLAFSLENQQTEEGLRLAGALGSFWEGHTHGFEGVEWLVRLLAVDQHVPAAVRAKALNRAGQLGVSYGDQRAEAFLREALTLARAENDLLNIAWALAGLGYLGCMKGDSRWAIPFEEESLALFRKLDDPLGMSHLLRRRAMAAIDLGDYAYANLLLDEALTSARAAGAKSAAASVLLISSSVSRLHDGDFDIAATRLQEGLALTREIRDVHTMIPTLKELGVVEHHRGNNANAMKLYAEALVLEVEFRSHFPAEAAECLAGLGSVAAAQGKLERAARLLAAAEAYRDSFLIFASFDNQVESLRVRLGEAAFAAAWALGKAMTREEALAYALQSMDLPVEMTQSHPDTNQGVAESLRPREFEVLRLVAEGCSNREIAERLFIGVSTVKKHINHIYNKLDVKNRTQAVARARERRMLD